MRARACVCVSARACMDPRRSSKVRSQRNSLGAESPYAFILNRACL